MNSISYFKAYFDSGGGYGNCTFVLLTGYFMVTSRVTAEKAFRLWLQVFTYSILSLIIYYVVTGDTHTRHIFIALTPISHNWYWFFTSYLILFLCSPVINQGIINLTKRQFLALTLVLLFFFSVLPTFGHGYLIDSNRIGLFFSLYCVGAWLRLYGVPQWNIKYTRYFAAIATCVAFGIAEWSILSNGWSNSLHMRYRYVWGMEQLPVVLMAISTLILMATIPIKSSKIINGVSATVFGVYLLHMNGFTTNMIWHDLFEITKWYKNAWMPVYLLSTGILIFVVCSIIDYLRLRFMEKPILRKVKEKGWAKQVDDFLATR